MNRRELMVGAVAAGAATMVPLVVLAGEVTEAKPACTLYLGKDGDLAWMTVPSDTTGIPPDWERVVHGQPWRVAPSGTLVRVRQDDRVRLEVIKDWRITQVSNLVANPPRRWNVCRPIFLHA